MEDSAYFVLILTTAFVVSLLGSFAARQRRRPPALRRIDAYQAMPLVVDEAIETNQRMHLSLGAAAIGQTTTLVALAALTLVYELAKRQAFTRNLPLVTTSDPITMAAAQDIMRRAYLARDNTQAYSSDAVVWYPQGERSVAFGAGVTQWKVGSNILMGTFGAEMAFVGESSIRRNRFFIGHSTLLEGQAIAYAQTGTPLIGEELFAGEAYLDPENPYAVGRLVALDVLRWIMIGVIILVALVD